MARPANNQARTEDFFQRDAKNTLRSQFTLKARARGSFGGKAPLPPPPLYAIADSLNFQNMGKGEANWEPIFAALLEVNPEKESNQFGILIGKREEREIGGKSRLKRRFKVRLFCTGCSVSIVFFFEM